MLATTRPKFPREGFRKSMAKKVKASKTGARFGFADSFLGIGLRSVRRNKQRS